MFFHLGLRMTVSNITPARLGPFSLLTTPTRTSWPWLTPSASDRNAVGSILDSAAALLHCCTAALLHCERGSQTFYCNIVFNFSERKYWYQRCSQPTEVLQVEFYGNRLKCIFRSASKLCTSRRTHHLIKS